MRKTIAARFYVLTDSGKRVQIVKIEHYRAPTPIGLEDTIQGLAVFETADGGQVDSLGNGRFLIHALGEYASRG